MNIQRALFATDFSDASEPSDMNLIGTHGRRGLPHMLAGSAAEKVIREAECPVPTVRQMKPATIKA